MEGNSLTYILLMNKENCALKLVDGIILVVLLTVITLPTIFSKHVEDTIIELKY